MGRLTLLLLLAVLAPLPLAAAGFAPQPLFLSKSPVTEGETVLVHAVVSNDTQARFEGEVRFLADGGAIGAVPVALSAGEARTVSVSWTPPAGTHKVEAQLRAENEVAATERATFAVAEKPKAPPPAARQEAAAIESSTHIQERIADFSPTAAQTARPAFEAVDSARERGVEFLDGQITQAKERLPQGGILGAETAKNAAHDPMGTALGVFYTFYLYLLTALRYALAHAALFYPLFAALFLWGLWKLYRRMSAR